MKTSRFSDSQILAILKQAEAGTPVSAVNQHRKLTTNQHPKLTSGRLKLLGFNTLFSLFKSIRIVARFQNIAMVGNTV